jgi:hypothetical protein
MQHALSLIFLAVSLAIMLPLGARYGRNPACSFGGSVGRAIMWSLAGCWSLVFVGGGHGAGVLPLPSVLALAFAALSAAGKNSFFLLSFPHVGISPLVPIAGFVLIAARKANTLPMAVAD